MSKHKLSEEVNPISSGKDVVVSTPSPQEKFNILVETNPSSILSR